MRMRQSEGHPGRLRMIYDSGEEYVGCFVDNASESGVMLEGPMPVPIGREIRLEPVDPLEDAWFGLRGRVTRCYEVDPDASIARWGAPLYAIDVQLLGVSTDQELAIAKALLKLEKHALEARHGWL